ncbi:MAG: hypothetical protein KDA58_15785 [Planctomycetaceae bacterium]|nr:hypothetical protein [Planctomycetaceae bacterium]
MKKLQLMFAGAVVVAMMLIAAPQAQARPEYSKAFKAKYEHLSEAIDAKKCGVCHGESKKMISDYAKALAKALGEKKVKDAEKITKALEAVEAQECGGGKTYGDVLKDGLPPGVK